MAVELSHYKFTVDDYHRMAAAGILTEDSRVELIEGEIIEMAALGGRHIRCVTVLNRLLVVAAGDAFFVSPQNSVRLNPRSEPEPDFALLRALPADTSPPPTEDVALIIEIADTSLLYDLNVKVPLYARTGIPEVWVVDLNGTRVIRHTEPRRGRYTRVEEFGPGDRVSSATVPPITLAVDDIFV
jgi:Uma2 family endonuclease